MQSSDRGPVDLAALAEDLLSEAAVEHSRRAARTLPHPVDGLRNTVIALLEGAELSEHNSPPGPAVLLVLRGAVRLVSDQETIALQSLQQVPIPAERHSLQADSDAVVVLSVALV